MENNKEQIFYPVEDIGIFEEMTSAGINNTEENFVSFNEGREKPHIFDDEIIERGINLYTEQLEHIDRMDSQINKWKKTDLTKEQLKSVEALSINNKKYRKLSTKTLTLLYELKKGTINTILDMDDEELALKVLSGELKIPE